jgi:pimeloyl-ACP methyl ester carboxylesterase
MRVMGMRSRASSRRPCSTGEQYGSREVICLDVRDSRGATRAPSSTNSGARSRPSSASADTFGLRRLRPSPLFTLTLINFLARPTDGSRDRFFRQCFVDMNGLQQQLGPLWQPLMTCALEGANSADQKAALRSMMPQLGWRAIPAEELARISVPTILIWGRHDRQTPLAVAQRASSRYRWPLHIIEQAADDPAFEQPGAVVSALSVAHALG